MMQYCPSLAFGIFAAVRYAGHAKSNVIVNSHVQTVPELMQPVYILRAGGEPPKELGR